MLGTLEKLSLYDTPEVASQRNVFKGDIDITGLPEDVVPYEAPEVIRSRNISDGKPFIAVDSPSKRFKSESPESIGNETPV